MKVAIVGASGAVGLYYIMFLAGLEMDMDDFKKNRTKGLVFGMFTFLIPMGQTE